MGTRTYQLQTKMLCGEWCDVPGGVYQSYDEACRVLSLYIKELGFEASIIRFRESDNEEIFFNQC